MPLLSPAGVFTNYSALDPKARGVKRISLEDGAWRKQQREKHTQVIQHYLTEATQLSDAEREAFKSDYQEFLSGCFNQAIADGQYKYASLLCHCLADLQNNIFTYYFPYGDNDFGTQPFPQDAHQPEPQHLAAAAAPSHAPPSLDLNSIPLMLRDARFANTDQHRVSYNFLGLGINTIATINKILAAYQVKTLAAEEIQQLVDRYSADIHLHINDQTQCEMLFHTLFHQVVEILTDHTHDKAEVIQQRIYCQRDFDNTSIKTHAIATLTQAPSRTHAASHTAASSIQPQSPVLIALDEPLLGVNQADLDSYLSDLSHIPEIHQETVRAAILNIKTGHVVTPTQLRTFLPGLRNQYDKSHLVARNISTNTSPEISIKCSGRNYHSGNFAHFIYPEEEKNRQLTQQTLAQFQTIALADRQADNMLSENRSQEFIVSVLQLVSEPPVLTNITPDGRAARQTSSITVAPPQQSLSQSSAASSLQAPTPPTIHLAKPLLPIDVISSIAETRHDIDHLSSCVTKLANSLRANPAILPGENKTVLESILTSFTGFTGVNVASAQAARMGCSAATFHRSFHSAHNQTQQEKLIPLFNAAHQISCNPQVDEATRTVHQHALTKLKIISLMLECNRLIHSPGQYTPTAGASPDTQDKKKKTIAVCLQAIAGLAALLPPEEGIPILIQVVMCLSGKDRAGLVSAEATALLFAFELCPLPYSTREFQNYLLKMERTEFIGAHTAIIAGALGATDHAVGLLRTIVNALAAWARQDHFDERFITPGEMGRLNKHATTPSPTKQSFLTRLMG